MTTRRDRVRTASHVDFEFYHELFGLERSYEILRGNYEELDAAIRIFQETDADRTRRSENRKMQRQRHIEIHRLLHNFVASAYSLLKHTLRNKDKFYGGTEFAEEYTREVARRLETAAVRDFVQDLRIYMQHRETVAVWASLRATESGVQSALELSVRDLESWDKWKPMSKSYMAIAGEHIRVETVIDEYMKLMEDFYEWFRHREEENHADVIDRVKRHLARSREGKR